MFGFAHSDALLKKRKTRTGIGSRAEALSKEEFIRGSDNNDLNAVIKKSAKLLKNCDRSDLFTRSEERNSRALTGLSELSRFLLT
jgi:hypothetical protein